MKYKINLKRLHQTKGKRCPCLISGEGIELQCPCNEFTLKGKCICKIFEEIK